MPRLIVASYDDEMRAILKYSLSKDKYVLYTAYNISEAIELLDDMDLNVLVYDLDNGGFPQHLIENYCEEHHLLVILTGRNTGMAFKFFSDKIGEFIIKPENFEDSFSYEFIEAIEHRISTYFTENRQFIRAEGIKKKNPKMANKTYKMSKFGAELDNEQVIVMGGSSGGSEAIMEILMALPKDMPPIIIVENFPKNVMTHYIQKMNNFSKLYVKESEDMEYISSGTVYFAPEGKNIELQRYGKQLVIAHTDDKKINGVVPSIDILFNSTAEIMKDKAIGVLLTGNGVDGSKGLFNLKEKGAITIGQDISTCIAKDKIKMAKSLKAVSMFVPLSDIATVLQSIADKNKTKQ